MLPKLLRFARSLLGVMPPRARRFTRTIYRTARPDRAVRKPNLNKPVPAWSLLLILLIGSGVGLAGSAMISAFSLETQSKALPDFTIGSSPVTLTLAQGYLSTFDVGLTSLNGFVGSVNLTASMWPLAWNSSLAFNPVTVSLFTGSASSKMTFSTGGNTPTGNYNLTLKGTSGRIQHSATIFVTLTPPPIPDFSITSVPSSLTITAGSSSFSTILLTSLFSFTGNVTLSATISPVFSNGPIVTVNPVRVYLSPGRTQASSLVVTTSNVTPTVTYTVLVVGTSGGLTHSIVVAVTVQ